MGTLPEHTSVSHGAQTSDRNLTIMLLRLDDGIIEGLCGTAGGTMSPFAFIPARLEEEPLMLYVEGGVELP